MFSGFRHALMMPEREVLRSFSYKGGGMSDRILIFNAKGAQIGYIEADRAFDLTGRERCKYVRATGNLSDLNGEKVVGHVS
jgi:hypothetical protein